jgi:hypothetical protein
MLRLCLVLLCLASVAHADGELRSNTVAIDPLLGSIGFTGKNLGEWAVSYERRLRPHHAVLLEQTTVHVHKDPWHMTVFGAGVGYRYLVNGAARTSPFVGVVTGGKLGTGRFGDMEPNGLMARAVFATAHAGWRWTSERGLTVTLRLGAGYAHYMLADDAPAGATEMQDDRLSPLPFEVDSEASVGWTF